MRYIVVPPPVPLIDLFDDKPFLSKEGKPLVLTFRDFFMSCLTDAKFGANQESLLAMIDLKTSYDVFAKSRSKVFPVPESHWELLASVTRHPSPNRPYNPATAWCFTHYLAAILDAPAKEPDLGPAPVSKAEQSKSNTRKAAAPTPKRRRA